MLEAELVGRRAQIVDARMQLEQLDVKSQYENTEVAATTCNLAELLYGEGKFDAADELFQEAIKISQSHLGSHHRKLAHYFRRYATFLHATGRHAESEALLQEATLCGSSTDDRGGTEAL